MIRDPQVLHTTQNAGKKASLSTQSAAGGAVVVATMNTKLQNFYYVLQETGRWLIVGSVICGFSHCCCSKYHDFNFSWAGMGHY